MGVAATAAVEEDTAQAATEAEAEVATEAGEEALDTVLVKSTLADNTAVRILTAFYGTTVLYI